MTGIQTSEQPSRIAITLAKVGDCESWGVVRVRIGDLEERRYRLNPNLAQVFSREIVCLLKKILASDWSPGQYFDANSKFDTHNIELRRISILVQKPTTKDEKYITIRFEEFRGKPEAIFERENYLPDLQ